MRMMRILISSWRRPPGEHRKLESDEALLRSASTPFPTVFFLSPNILAWRWRFGMLMGVSFSCQTGGQRSRAGWVPVLFHWGARSLGPGIGVYNSI